MKALKAFVEQNKELTLGVSLFNTAPIRTLYIKYKLLSFVLSFNKTIISRDDVSIYLEGINLAVSTDDALGYIESFGFVKRNDSAGYEIKQEISLKDMCADIDFRFPKQLLTKTYTLADIREAFYEDTQLTTFSISDIINSVRNGVSWICKIVDTSHNSEGLPAFWNCQPDEDIPGGFQIAGTCNSDALSILLSAKDSVLKFDNSTLGTNVSTLLKFIKNTRYCTKTKDTDNLKLQQWHKGAFYSLEDQPSADYPSVDATWDVTIALSLYILDDNVTREAQHIITYITTATDFLLRVQLDDGGWGNYRYLNDTSPVISNIYTTTKVITALKLVRLLLQIGQINSDTLLGMINSCLEKTLPYFEEQIQNCGTIDSSITGTNYVPCNQDSIFKRLLICNGILILRQVFDSEQNFNKLSHSFMEEFLTYLTNEWSVNYKSTLEYKYRVPKFDNMSEVSQSWIFKRDVLISDFLLKHQNQYKTTISKDLMGKIETTVFNVIGEQHEAHGHWHHPASGRPFVVSTMFSIDLLLSYLKFIREEIDN